MMQLTEEMRRTLDERFKCCFYGNVPGLAQPVLIIFDYSPTDNGPLLSIAFDGEFGPKCWMSENQVKTINGKGPNLNDGYGNFQFRGRQFYGYSIVAFSQSEFDDIDRLEDACRRHYAHIVWPSS